MRVGDQARDSQTGDDVVVLPRDVVMRMATHVGIMYEQWPALVAHQTQVKAQQVEHERRLVQLERYWGVTVMKQPIVIAKLVLYFLVMGLIYYLGQTGKIDTNQVAADMTLVSAVLIGALGLKGAADSFGTTVAKYLQPLLPLVSAVAPPATTTPPDPAQPPAPAPVPPMVPAAPPAPQAAKKI